MSGCVVSIGWICRGLDIASFYNRWPTTWSLWGLFEQMVLRHHQYFQTVFFSAFIQQCLLCIFCADWCICHFFFVQKLQAKEGLQMNLLKQAVEVKVFTANG